MYVYIYISVCVYVCTVACECFLCFSTSWVPILDDFSSHLNMQHLETRMNMTHAVYVCGGTLRLCMHVWVSACVCTANAKAGSANAMIIYLSVCLEWMSHVYNRIGVWWLCKQVCKQDVAQQDATIPGQFRTNCRVRVQNTTIWCSLQAWDHTNDEILLPESTKIHQSNQCEGKKTRFLDTAFHIAFLYPWWFSPFSLLDHRWFGWESQTHIFDERMGGYAGIYVGIIIQKTGTSNHSSHSPHEPCHPTDFYWYQSPPGRSPQSCCAGPAQHQRRSAARR